MLPAYSELFATGFLEVDDQREEVITPSVPEDHGSLKDDDFFYQNTIERVKAKD